MQVNPASSRRAQAQPSAQQKEEWQRSGFDVVLAQALFGQPFLAPTPTAPRAPASPAGSENPGADRPSGDQNPTSTDAGTSPMTAKPAEPATANQASESETAPVEHTAQPEVKPPPLEARSTETPAAELLASGPASASSRGPVLTSSAPRAEVGGIGAVGAGSYSEGRSSGEHPDPSSQAPPPAPPADRTSAEEAAKAAQAFRPVEVRFDAGDGQEGRLRVSVQGESVRATILAPDAPLARQLERSVPEIRRALQEKGFRKTEVKIQPPRARAETAGQDAESGIAAYPER